MAQDAAEEDASVIFATQSLADIDRLFDRARDHRELPDAAPSCRWSAPSSRRSRPVYRRFGLNDRQIEILKSGDTEA